MKFGPKKINPGTGRLVTQKGKTSSMQMLPARHALNRLTKGDPSERSFQSYAKATPSGDTGALTYQNIIDMGTLGIDPKQEG